MLERTQREDGSWELKRPKLAADNRNFYTVTQRTINALKDQRTTYQDAREAHDGYLASWRERGRFQRDGKQWVIVQEGYFEYAVELEITADGDIGDVIPLSPERAYELAKAADPPNVIQEG
jgi:hypothetical protein